MKVLAIDTATPHIVTGIVDITANDLTEVAGVSRDGATSHAEVLTPAVRSVCEQAGVTLASLDGIVVGLGPGPFTGLRVGIVTAAALGDALGLPVWGVCSLDAMAPAAGRALVVTDARRKELYYAIYDDGVRRGEPSVDRPDAVMAAAGAVDGIVHAGAEKYLSLLGSAQERFPTPESLVRVAVQQGLVGAGSTALQPIYIRRPDAAEPKQPMPLDVTGPRGE